MQKRISSSSNEPIDTSDENMDFVADADFQPDYEDVPVIEEQDRDDGAVQLGTSRPMQAEIHHGREPAQLVRLMVEERGEQIVIEVENSRARIYEKPGNLGISNNTGTALNQLQQLMRTIW